MNKRRRRIEFRLGKKKLATIFCFCPLRGYNIKMIQSAAGTADMPLEKASPDAPSEELQVSSIKAKIAFALLIIVIVLVIMSVVAFFLGKEKQIKEDEDDQRLSRNLFSGIFSGLIGPAGETWKRGEKRIQGERGPRGPRGPAGPQGERGLQGIVGPPGMDGKQGSQGPPGKRGKQGPAGENGLRGETGQRGAQGERGDEGPAGPRGERGPRGEPGPPPSHDWPFFERHIRAKLAWKGDNVMKTVGVVGSYDSTRQACPIVVTKSYKKHTIATGLGYRNWNGLRIELSVENDEKKQIVSFDVKNCTNSPLLIAALHAESCNFSDSVLVSEIPPGNIHTRDASYCISKTDNNEILQCVFPGASGVFKIDFKLESTEDVGVLFLADTLQTNTVASRPSIFESDQRLIEQAGKFLQKPSAKDIKVVVLEGKQLLPETVVASINNPIVRLKLPTAQEINSMYNLSENMDMLKYVVLFLKRDSRTLRSSTVTEEEFSIFLLYFLLHSSVLYLTKTGWDKASLERTTCCECVVRSGVIDIASSYMIMSETVSDTFMRERVLFRIPSYHNIASKKISDLVPELMKELLGISEDDLFEQPKTVASLLA